MFFLSNNKNIHTNKLIPSQWTTLISVYYTYKHQSQKQKKQQQPVN